MTIKALQGTLIAALAVSTVLPRMIVDFGYRAYDMEVIALSLAAMVIGFSVFWLVKGSLRAVHLVTAILLYWNLDSYFTILIPLALVAVILVVIVCSMLWPHNFTGFYPVPLTFCIFWLGSNIFSPVMELAPPMLAFNRPATEVSQQAPPPLVHLILDELMSPSALPESIPNKEHPAMAIISDYTERGFNVYSDARAAAAETVLSIGNLFGLRSGASNSTSNNGGLTYSIKYNRYFETLLSLGYELTVVQSNYFRLCDTISKVKCHEYSTSRNGHAFAARLPEVCSRLQYAMLQLYNSFMKRPADRGVWAFYAVNQIFSKTGNALEMESYSSHPAVVLDLLDQLPEKMEAIQPGQALIFHALLPHSPFVLDRYCTINPLSDWVQNDTRIILPGALPGIYEKYWDQTACTHKKLMHLVDRLLDSPAKAKLVILVHGDHGARITRGVQGGIDERDLLQSLFAIRRPGTAGKVVEEKRSLQELFIDAVEELSSSSN